MAVEETVRENARTVIDRFGLPGPWATSVNCWTDIHGCSISSMRECVMLSLFVFLLIVPLTFCTLQAATSNQAGVKGNAPEPKWTDDDRRQLLAKARRGDADAQFWLAAGYEQGSFGEPNIPEALKWCRKSAAKGNQDAQNELGRMYEDGEGVKQNFGVAAKWYRKAAEHVPDLGGASQGRNNLGMLYLVGRGVPKDYIQAYMWFSLFRGTPNQSLAYAKEHLTQQQILEAERKAEEWKIRHHDQQD